MTTNHDLIEKLKCEVLRTEEVEEALRNIPREWFVPEEYMDRAYEDNPLPLASGQTISQPFTVVVMTELLSVFRGHKVLEVGAGSGWQAALLGHLVGPKGKVFTVDINDELVEMARKNLEKTKLKNVEIIHGDGSKGLEDKAPFDRVIITAAAPKIPPPIERQVLEGGKLVAPVGDMRRQQMTLYEKTRMGLREIRSAGVYRFVPLIGEHGFRCRMW